MKKKQQFMSHNINKDAIFIIKHAWYIYVRDFEYIVCFSEYLSIFVSCTMKLLVLFYFCSFDTIDFKTELY